MIVSPWMVNCRECGVSICQWTLQLNVGYQCGNWLYWFMVVPVWVAFLSLCDHRLLIVYAGLVCIIVFLVNHRLTCKGSICYQPKTRTPSPSSPFFFSFFSFSFFYFSFSWSEGICRRLQRVLPFALWRIILSYTGGC